MYMSFIYIKYQIVLYFDIQEATVSIINIYFHNLHLKYEKMKK